MPTNSERDQDPTDLSVETIPLEETASNTNTRRPADLPNNGPTISAGSRNPRENVGVDDGLLDNGNGGGPTGPKPHPAGPDAIEPGEVDVEEPEIGGGRGGQPRPEPRPRPRPENPWKPVGPVHPHDRPDPSVNNGINYTTKKNIAQGMMDIALLTANASQLRYVMRSPYWDIYHQVNIVLISISIALQIIAGILLVFISRYDYKKKEARDVTQIMSDVVVIFIFAITIVNIFIATFGVDDERTTFLRWKQASTDASSEPIHMSPANSSIVRP